MTKREQMLVNSLLFGIIKSRSRKLADARRFDKRYKPGFMLMVVPIKTVLKEWKKLMIETNYGLPVTKGSKKK